MRKIFKVGFSGIIMKASKTFVFDGHQKSLISETNETRTMNVLLALVLLVLVL